MIAGRHVKAPVATSQAFSERTFIGEPSFNNFIPSPHQTTYIAVRTQQRSHAMACLHQSVDKIGADKTRGARHKTFHCARYSAASPGKSKIFLPAGFPEEQPGIFYQESLDLKS